jgi:glycerophosphoryl diester phosphodiesterase
MTSSSATKPMSALIGHRGLPSQAPENTAASIKAAFEQGIDWIEVDVTMAGDGTLVILHDTDLRRFGQPGRTLASLDRAALLEVDAGGWFHADFAGEPILFMAQLMTLMQRYRLGLNLELKVNPDLAMPMQVDAVVEALRPAALVPSKLVVSSFDHQALGHLRQRWPGVAIGILFGALPPELPAALIALKPVSIHCDQALLTAPLAAKIVPRYPLYCYTVNDPATLATLLSWGVSGVFSDRAQAEELRQVVLDPTSIR